MPRTNNQQSIPMRAISIPCPRCHHRVPVAKNRTMSDMMKEITYMCPNPVCHFIFVASLGGQQNGLQTRVCVSNRAKYPADAAPCIQ
ncbi:ogr/Delta-like zinc finger family protein [Collimonas sp. NPDC087041]|uniref:ogr/Delta-like zinc finger family protein n=1 Tax=Collimonas sp. NPDC087041 TaxID=3363960 RepID=UPI0037F36BD4